VTDLDFTPGKPCLAVELVTVRTIEDQPHVLLVTETAGPCIDMEALPGGLVAYRETIAAAGARILADRTGLAITAADLASLALYEAAYRHIAEWTIAQAYMIEADRLPGIADAELPAGARWAPVAELVDAIGCGVLLAYNGSAIVRDAAQVLVQPDLWPPSTTKTLGTDLRDRA
jgi:ADP-ribose pyrophosphatase YjhB (NUDIX family)